MTRPDAFTQKPHCRPGVIAHRGRVAGQPTARLAHDLWRFLVVCVVLQHSPSRIKLYYLLVKHARAGSNQCCRWGTKDGCLCPALGA